MGLKSEAHDDYVCSPRQCDMARPLVNTSLRLEFITRSYIGSLIVYYVPK